MSAWTQLIANSTLTSGTAWQHLQNQQGGGGAGPTYVVMNDGFNVDLEDTGVVALLQDIEVEVVLDDSPIEVIINDDDIEAEVV